MRTLSEDTSPAMERIQLEGYRRMTPQQKLQLVSSLTLATQQLARARLRKQYPEATERETQLRLAALRLERETMIRVFGWDPVKEGY